MYPSTPALSTTPLSQLDLSEGVTADYSQPTRRSATALRSGNILHVDTELQTAAAEVAKEVKQVEDSESLELRLIASLADHPGWRIVRAVFEERINQYRSGSILGEALADASIPDSVIGAMTRNTNIIAAELTTLVNKVELAALEDQRQREEARNATVQQRVVSGA